MTVAALGTDEALILRGAIMTRDGTVRWEGHLPMLAEIEMIE